jgi:hypothetical protein
LRYTPPKAFNPANTAAAEEAIYDREQILIGSETYNSFQTRIDSVYAPTEREADAIVAEIRQERAAWLRNNLTEYARSQQDLYGESWVAAMGPTLQAIGLSSDALKATEITTTELPAAAEEAFDPTTLNLPESLTVDDEGLVNGIVTVTHVNTDGEPQDITFEVEGGVVLNDGVPLRPEESEAILREVSRNTVVPEVAAEEGDEEVEDPIMAAYLEYGQSRKEGTPLTAEDIRNQAGAVSESVVDASNTALSLAQSTTQTAGMWADRGLAYAATPFSKVISAADMAIGSILDSFGYTEAADTAYGMVADRVNNRVKQREDGFFANLFESEGGNDESVMLDVMSKIFGFNKDELEDNPELVKAVTDLSADVRQRIGTVGFQDLGLRPDVRVVQESPETASDRLSTGSKSMPNGYIQVRIGATELNLPSVIEGLSVAARNALEKDLEAWSERPTPRKYQPPRIGATELNLPKMLEALKPKTRNVVEKELQALPETPERRANAARDQRVSNEVNRRELTEGATKIAEMLSRPTSEVSQEELTNFIMEVNAKFGADAVKAELLRVIGGGAAQGGTE